MLDTLERLTRAVPKLLFFAAAAAAQAVPSPSAAQAVPSPPPVVGAPLAADTPETTMDGNTFIAPAGWTVRRRGSATIVEAPERDSWLALVDVGPAGDAEAALAAAWAVYKPEAKWPVKVATDQPDRDGWTSLRAYEYRINPNDRRDVAAYVQAARGRWTVLIYDVNVSVGEKRGAQIELVFDRFYPKGYTRESFAGKKARALDDKAVAELGRFVEEGRRQLGIPGVAVGLVQDGKVVFAGGYGVRELGGTAPVGPDTLFMIASNTKALTTLLLAKLVADGRMTWDTPVTKLLPGFELGDAETTRQVLVKHLICACTGMPRQDMEWLLQSPGNTPARLFAWLATMKPTSSFGELFQYSNPLAAAAGFVAGHVAFPEMELGAAYDRAMQTYVFDPLGMKSTLFDPTRALAGDHALPAAPDVDGKPAPALMAVNRMAFVDRPAGAAWSSVRDLLRYVQMELDDGKLPDGRQYIAAEPLLARRAPQVAMGKDATYGMGLMVDTTYGVPVVHHGGDLVGYHSDMMWLPEQKVGAVFLTNGDLGRELRYPFRRKWLELLFDGRPEADADVAATAKAYFTTLAAERQLLMVPPAPSTTARLAERYGNPATGDIVVARKGPATLFEFGQWASEVASRRNADGTFSFVTVTPGMRGLEFLMPAGAKKTLVLRDAQHEYVFEEKRP